MAEAVRVSLVATLTGAPEPADFERLPAGVECLEVRGDLVGDLDAAWFRSRFAGKLLYTLRSRAEGGGFAGSSEERYRRLAAAAGKYDLVDLEAERDLRPELLSKWRPEQRVLSWHGGAGDLAELRHRFDRYAETPARLYKLVPEARQSGEELAPLALLAALRREDVIAFASGELGAWTRLVAPRLGAHVAFGSWGPRPGAPGQPSIESLVADFGLPELGPVERLFGVVGNPISHSLSPRLHNAAYRALGIPALYVPFHVPSFGDFWLEIVESGSLEVLELPLGGLSVTAPHKEVALVVAGAASPLAQRVGAANTLVRARDGRGEVWEAETTDPEGLMLALESRGVTVAGRRAAVVGCGGAGRAAALGLAHGHAEVTLVNRGAERGTKAAAELDLPFMSLADFDPRSFDLLVNATSLGRDPGDELPFEPGDLAAEAVIVDLAYRVEGATELTARAHQRGLVTVEGREVLLYQAVRQFRMMTGRDLPVELGREQLDLS